MIEFPVNEYDLSSIGRKFAVRKYIDLPQRVDFGEHEKAMYIDNRANLVADEVASEILKQDILEVRKQPHEVVITADFILLTPKEYYNILRVIERIHGTTRLRVPADGR